MKMMTLAALAAICGGAITARAQTAGDLFQGAINAKGKSCIAVTAMNPFATSSSGDALVGVACSGGEQYLLAIKPNRTIEYVSTCSTFESVSGVSCF